MRKRRIRAKDDDGVDWYLISEPKITHNAFSKDVSVKAGHISQLLKTKNLGLEFSDEEGNNVGTAEQLLTTILDGTGWIVGYVYPFTEKRGGAIKIRSMKASAKTGAFKLIANMCDLFDAKPVYHGEGRIVDIVPMNPFSVSSENGIPDIEDQNKHKVLELHYGKNVKNVQRTLNTENIVTKLYAYGAYGDRTSGYCGIDEWKHTEYQFFISNDIPSGQECVFTVDDEILGIPYTRYFIANNLIPSGTVLTWSILDPASMRYVWDGSHAHKVYEERKTDSVIQLTVDNAEEVVNQFSFLMDFDYYNTIGLLTDDMIQTIAQYQANVPALLRNANEAATNFAESLTNLSEVIGSVNFCKLAVDRLIDNNGYLQLDLNTEDYPKGVIYRTDYTVRERKQFKWRVATELKPNGDPLNDAASIVYIIHTDTDPCTFDIAYLKELDDEESPDKITLWLDYSGHSSINSNYDHVYLFQANTINGFLGALQQADEATIEALESATTVVTTKHPVFYSQTYPSINDFLGYAWWWQYSDTPISYMYFCNKDIGDDDWNRVAFTDNEPDADLYGYWYNWLRSVLQKSSNGQWIELNESPEQQRLAATFGTVYRSCQTRDRNRIGYYQYYSLNINNELIQRYGDGVSETLPIGNYAIEDEYGTYHTFTTKEELTSVAGSFVTYDTTNKWMVVSPTDPRNQNITQIISSTLETKDYRFDNVFPNSANVLDSIVWVEGSISDTGAYQRDSKIIVEGGGDVVGGTGYRSGFCNVYPGIKYVANGFSGNLKAFMYTIENQCLGMVVLTPQNNTFITSPNTRHVRFYTSNAYAEITCGAVNANTSFIINEEAYNIIGSLRKAYPQFPLVEGSGRLKGIVPLTKEFVTLSDNAYNTCKTRVDNAQAQIKLYDEQLMNALGDMYREGYWQKNDYVDGDEQKLYSDALENVEKISKPEATYNVSYLDRYGSNEDEFEYGASQQIYDVYWPDIEIDYGIHLVDPSISVSQWAFIDKLSKCYDQPWKTTIQINTNLSTIGQHSFADVMTNIANVASAVSGKMEVYDRAMSFDSYGNIPTTHLEGKIDANKLLITGGSSTWYTDDKGNMVFESADGKSAMTITGNGFSIANSKDEYGDWQWRTFGTGEGFTADLITAGTIDADRVITSKLISRLNETLTITSTEGIELIVGDINRVLNDTKERVDNINDTIDHSIKNIVVQYRLSDSSEELDPDDDEINVDDKYLWSTIPPTWENGKYLWSRYVTTYNDNTFVSSSPACISGSNGRDGIGVAVAEVKNFYGANNSSTVPPETFVENPTNAGFNETNKYLWNYEITYSSDNNVIGETEPCVIAVWSQDGENGTSIVQVKAQYATNTSKSQPPLSGWSYDPPSWSYGTYLWIRNEITYSNNNVETTRPYCDSSWSAIDEMQIGGSNLIRNSTNVTRSTENALSQLSFDTIENTQFITLSNYPNADGYVWVSFRAHVLTQGYSLQLHCIATAGQELGNIILKRGVLGVQTGGTVKYNAEVDQDGWQTICVKLPSSFEVYPRIVKLGSIENSVITYDSEKLELSSYPTTWTPSNMDISSALIDYMDDISEQLDGKLNTWVYSGVPTNQNEPAVNWTNEQKQEHVDDLYYESATGNCYRYSYNQGTAEYNWVVFNDIENISSVANSKRRIFTVQPTTPYDVGDLWVQGSTGDILVCLTSRQAGGFNANDWSAASKYTDDTLAASKIKDVRIEYRLSTSASLENGQVVPVTATEDEPYFEWSQTAPEWRSNLYMWQRTLTSTDGTTFTELSKTCISGSMGHDGIQITDVTNWYALNNSDTQYPSIPNDLQTLPQNPNWNNSLTGLTPTASNRYLWNFEVVTYSNAPATRTDPIVVVSYVENGRSLEGIIEQYAVHTSNSDPSGIATWTDNSIPSYDLPNGKYYLWNREKITYDRALNGNVVHYTTARLIDTYSSVINYYLATQSNEAPLTSDQNWVTSVADTNFGENINNVLMKYLWNYEQNIPGNNTVPAVIAVWSEEGPRGETGTSITGVEEYYQRTNSNTPPSVPVKSGSTWNMNGWSSASVNPTSSQQYLWNCEKIIYSSGDPTYTTPHLATKYSVSVVSIEYCETTTRTGSPPETGWDDEVPGSTDPGHYLWTKVTYSDGSASYSVSYSGINGVGIDRIQEQYATTSTPSYPSEWFDTVQTMDETNRFLWNREIVIFSDDPNHTQTQNARIIGVYGAAGDDGVGYVSVYSEYVMTDDPVNPPDETYDDAWSGAMPEWEYGKYLWIRVSMINTEDEITHMDPYCDSSWQAINDVQVGAENLLIDTKDSPTTFTATSGNVTYEFNSISMSTYGAGWVSFRIHIDNESLSDARTNWQIGLNVTAGPTASATLGSIILKLGVLGTVAGNTAFYEGEIDDQGWSTVVVKIPTNDYTVTPVMIGTAGSSIIYSSPKLEFGSFPTTWSPAPIDIQNKINEVAYVYAASLKTLNDHIEAVVGKTNDINTYLTEVFQGPEGLVATVSQHGQTIQDLSTSIKFDIEGLHLTESANASYEALLSSDELSFKPVGQENVVASFGVNGGYVDKLRSNEKLSVGTEASGWFDMVAMENGTADKWRNGTNARTYRCLITKQPVNYYGTGDIQFSVSAENATHYQWKRRNKGTPEGFTNVGSDNSIYITSNNNTNLDYEYCCTITGTGGDTVDTNIVYAYNPTTPDILVNISDKIQIQSGSSVPLTFVVQSSNAITYQWYVLGNNATWTAISGATSNKMMANAEGTYRCVATTSNDDIVSNSCRIEVVS